MATISRSFATEQTVMSAVSVTTGSASSDIDLETDGYEGVHITVDADFPGTPTDNLVVEVQGSLDGTNYDDTPLMAFEIDNGTDPNQASVVIRDVSHCRLYCYRDGSTDTITVTAKCQRWRYTSA